MATIRRSAFIGALGAASFALGGRSVGAQPAPLRVAASTADTYAQAIYAQGAGIFRDAALNVEIVQLPNTGAIAAAVVGGSLDIGLGSPLTIAGGREQGVPFVTIAPGGEYLASAPTTLLVVAKDSPLRSPAQLDGKIVGADNIKGMTQVAISAWLSQNGGDPASLRYVEIPFSTMGAALSQGRISAGLMAEPALTGASAVTRVFGNPFAAIAQEWYICDWYVTESWLAKNEALAHTFATAIIRASAWANAHHAETAPMLQKYLPVSDAVLREMRRARFAERLTPALMQPVLDAGVKGGVIKGTVSARELIAPAFSAA